MRTELSAWNWFVAFCEGEKNSKCSDVVRGVTKHNTPIHNILWTAPRLSVSQKTLGMLPEDGNVTSKRVVDTIHN
jgi:hypothetical protein